MKKTVIWLTGLSGSGKTTLSNELKNLLDNVKVLDGDEIRALNKNNSFTEESRNLHVKKVGEFAVELLNDYDVIICSLISPFEESRNYVKDSLKEHCDFILVHVKCSLDECIKRDTKGLYIKALNNEIDNFTGISQRYEEPLNPDLIIDTENFNINDSVHKILNYMKK